MNNVPHAVFLSYASQDAEAARRICGALRAAGVEVWFDQSELVGGDAWDARIRQQIRSCALFIPIISAATQARGEGYFRLEWKLAEDRSHLMAKSIPFIVPVSIDGTPEQGALVPDSFLAVQWTRLARSEATPEFVARIKQLLKLPVAVGPVAGQFAATRHPSHSSLPIGESASASEAATRGEPVPRIHHRFAGWACAALVIAAAGIAVFVATRKSTPADKSIAVLPFVNLGADKADEYLGDGMSEELLNVLAKLRGLRVAGRTSSFAFKGRTDENIFRKVGAQLNVRTVLEGSVRKVGDKLRITAELINVSDGFHLWSETYDRDFSDILAIQSDVAQRVVQVLQVKLGLQDAQALAKRPTENAEAHRLYLLGRHRFVSGTQTSLSSALQTFHQVIALDPGYALAYCGISDTYGWMGVAALPGREAWAKEKEWAEKALALDPLLADAHLSLGIALAGSFDWRAGEKAMRRALELNPNLAFAHDQLGWLYWVLGRSAEADVKIRKSIDLDPLNPIFNTDLAAVAYFDRRYDDGIAQLQRTLDLHPHSCVAYAVLGWCKRGKGDAAGAAAAFERAYALDDVPWYAGSMGGALAAAGERAKAEQVLQQLTELSKRRYVSPGSFAHVYLGLGDNDQALDWLEKGYEEQDGVCWNLRVDPLYDRLRDHPRFRVLLKKVGLAR